MLINVRARISKGIIEPDEKINIPEGTKVIVTIKEITAKSRKDAFDRAAGSWKGTIDAERLIKNIYDSRCVSTRKLPRL
ncbi:MAG: antitoxin family protein [Candidatus Schekmanbacteria bacterium]|nr:antitoxin family protein [Candidatus Schekmanbacteria bacterium]